MGTYGRYFDFLRSPQPQHRLGRFKTGNAAIVQGAPVVGAGEPDPFDDRWTLALAAQASAPVRGAKSGILQWEAPYTGLHGFDPVTTRPSDIDTCPAHTPAAIAHGDEVAVVLHNLDAWTFVQHAYPGRNMIKPADAITLAADNFLTPGAGNGTTGGYWEKTNTASLAWLQVIKADFDDDGFGYAECAFLF